MSELADLRRVYLRELETFRNEVRSFPDDDTLWVTPAGVTNSAGTLALHVAGNLRHFIGAVLGGTGYARNREEEFAARGLPRSAVVDALEAASAEVSDTLTRLDPSALDRPYPQAVGGVSVGTRRFLMHLAVHLGFHLGQAGYVRRIVTGVNTSTNGVPVAALAEP